MVRLILEVLWQNFCNWRELRKRELTKFEELLFIQYVVNPCFHIKDIWRIVPCTTVTNYIYTSVSLLSIQATFGVRVYRVRFFLLFFISCFR